MSQMIFSYADPIPPHARSGTVTLNPALAKMVQPRYSPIQKVSIAESGEVWVYQLSSNIELELLIDLMDIPTTSRATPVPHDGYVQLRTFLQSSVNWSQFPFLFTDPDGDSFTVRYMTGFETLVEAAGRAQKVDSWSGTLTLRRVI
jgi:hypothetical protein